MDDDMFSDLLSANSKAQEQQEPDKDYLLLNTNPTNPESSTPAPNPTPNPTSEANSMPANHNTLKLADIEETVRDAVTSAVDITVAKLARGIKATLEDFSNRISSIQDEVKELKESVVKLDGSHETLRAGIATRFGKIEEDTSKTAKILQSLKDKQDFMEAKGLLDTLSNKIAKDAQPVPTPPPASIPEEKTVVATPTQPTQQPSSQPQVQPVQNQQQTPPRTTTPQPQPQPPRPQPSSQPQPYQQQPPMYQQQAPTMYQSPPLMQPTNTQYAPPHPQPQPLSPAPSYTSQQFGQSGYPMQVTPPPTRLESGGGYPPSGGYNRAGSYYPSSVGQAPSQQQQRQAPVQQQTVKETKTLDEVVRDFEGMGFSRGDIMNVVNQQLAHSQQLDFNAVLDKLMNSGGGKMWS